MKITIKTKLLTLIIGIVIVGSLSIGSLSYNKAKKALETSVSNTLNEVSMEVEREVRDINDAEFSMLHALAQLPEIRSEEVSIADKCKTFRNIINANPDKYENIAFYDTEGNTTLPNGAPLQLKGKAYIEGPVTTGKDYIQDPAFSTVNNSVIMFMSVPVYNADNKAIGALVSVIKGNVLNDIAMNIEITPGHHPNIINRNTSEIIAKGNSEGDDRVDTDEISSDNNLLNIIKKICDGESGIETYTDPITNEKKIASYRPVEGYNWSVFCPAPYDDFYGDLFTLNRSIMFIIFITIVIAILISVALINVIVNPLKDVRNSMTEIASGNADLTKRIQSKSNDEIGDVVKGFNNFTEKLQSIMGQLKSSKDNLTSAGQNLSECTIDTSSSITQIIANIDSVHDQINNSSNSVSQTAAAVNQIASNIDSLEKMIENQSQSVSSASTAVEEMVGNITSVNNSVDLMANSFNELYANTIEGSKLQISVNEKIEQIKTQSETLQEANKVIASIASQTNLLAMNAAIEAAHAGEAGKGFSVVADEIRKLSQTSTAQSNTIGSQLERIRNSINEVVDESIQTNEAFAVVTQKIKDTDQLVQQIKNAMNEQNVGSMQINESLHTMNDSTVEVNTASKEMAEGNKSILTQIQSLQNITSEIAQSMNEMSVGAKKINETGSALSSISAQIGETIEEIGSQIDLFKI